MKIDFENLGNIEQGSVTLNDFTVFCGKNNSGKTYVVYSIYGLVTNDFIVKPFDFVKEIWSELKKTGTYQLDISDIIDKHFNEIINDLEKHFKNYLPSLFGVKQNDFINTKISLYFNKENLIKQVKEREFFYTSDFLSLKQDNLDYLHVKKDMNNLIIKLTLPDIESANEISESVLFHISRALFLFITDLSKESFLLPAERTGINIFYKELFSIRNLLLQESQNDNVNPMRLLKDVLNARYAEPDKDYLHFLNQISSTKNEISDYTKYAEIIQNDIVKGKYVVDDFGNIFFTPFDSEKKSSLPLHFCSSTVKSLFGLAFYLEHLAKDGDYLMIDEPELNLHPDNQRKVAQVLAQLVNAGLKVVVSTHSDYFVRELNNLIMLKNDFSGSEELRKKYNYQESELLDNQRISAYLFDNNEITQMTLGEEGIVAQTFNEVINNINQSSNEIYYAMQDAKEMANW